ncbi:hypothetical protein BH23THE1_BH23THE1_33010 [soil metagenome]
MPSSQYYQIPKIIEMLISINPHSVIDIGSGFGKFGVLCREYLDLRDGRQKYEFKRRIDCVEVFHDYISPLHNYVYNKTYNDNILDIVSKLKLRYDLVLLIDVLEHFEKNDGKELLKTLLKNNEGIIISTPKKPSPQKDAFGNIYETHRSVWSKRDLKRFGESHFIKDDISWICYISSKPNLIDEFARELKTLKKSKKTGS